MDDWLMVFMHVLLNNDWLVVLVDNLLMMFVKNIFLVLNNHIFVMFMDDVLMDFLDDGGSDVGSHVSGKLVSFNGLTFIGLLVDCLFVVSDNNWLFVDLLNNDLTFNICTTGHTNSSL